MKEVAWSFGPFASLRRTVGATGVRVRSLTCKVTLSTSPYPLTRLPAYPLTRYSWSLPSPTNAKEPARAEGQRHHHG